MLFRSRKLNFKPEQVQDFTPTPMTLATEIFYTGFHPYIMQQIYTARTKTEKLEQRKYFFWYKPEEKKQIIKKLQLLKRQDLIKKLFGNA